jgi:putative nucleotidyltransferase with HDIG domain
MQDAFPIFKPNNQLDIEQLRLRIQRMGLGGVDHAIVKAVCHNCLYGIPLAKLAELISPSPALAAMICRAASQVEYNPTPIPSVLYALELLEPKKIREICLTSSFYGGIESDDKAAKTVQCVSRHCMAMGVFARNLARLKNTVDPEAAFTCGLFCDAGYVAMARFIPDLLERVMSTVFSTPDISASEVETHIIGFNHAQIGNIVAQEFGLTPEVQEAILHHNNPSYCSPDAIELADLCHLTAWILDRIGFPALPVDPQLQLDPFILRRIKLTVQQMQTTLRASRDELTELLNSQSHLEGIRNNLSA